MNHRRLSLPYQSLMVGYVAWEKGEDGAIYYATESVGLPFIRDLLAVHGREAVRRFRSALRAELEAEVRARLHRIADPTYAVEIFQRPRTFEQMCEMAGIDPAAEKARLVAERESA